MIKGRKKERQIEAAERQERYNKLNNKEKLKLAQSRRGNSIKEISKLRRLDEKRHEK